MSLVVLSPHLDDAIMSVGGLLHRLAAHDVATRIVTLFAGDLGHQGAPSLWDGRRGVATAAEVFRARRAEDAVAAARIGAETVWLPFCDAGYGIPIDLDALWDQVLPHLHDASVVLVPGFPLVHSDHELTALLALERTPREIPVACYAEEPYCFRPRYFPEFLRRSTPAVLERVMTGPLEWSDVRLDAASRAAKRNAVAAYAGELQALGFRTRLDAVMARALRRERVAAMPGRTMPALLRAEASA